MRPAVILQVGGSQPDRADQYTGSFLQTRWYVKSDPPPPLRQPNAAQFGGMVTETISDPYSWATIHLDKYWVQPSELRKRLIDLGTAAQCGGMMPLQTTPDQLGLFTQWQIMAPDVLLRPRPAIYPQNPNEQITFSQFDFTVTAWYRQANEPPPVLSQKIDRTSYTQPLETAQVDQKLAWLTPPPLVLPLPPRRIHEGLAEVFVPDSLRFVFGWYVQATELPRPAVNNYGVGVVCSGNGGGTGATTPWLFTITLTVTGPYFITASTIYCPGAVAFDSEPS